MKYYVMVSEKDIPAIVSGAYSVAIYKQNGFAVKSEHDTLDEAMEQIECLEAL